MIFFDAIDAYVDDNGARLEPVSFYHVRAANCGDNDIRGSDDIGQVLRSAVGHGDSCVCLQQQREHRLADDIGAPDDDRALSGQVRAELIFNHQHTAGRRARDKSIRGMAGGEFADIDEVETIDVFARYDRLCDRLFIEVRR